MSLQNRYLVSVQRAAAMGAVLLTGTLAGCGAASDDSQSEAVGAATSALTQVDINVSNVAQLYAIFSAANANPSTLFVIHLAPGTYQLSCSQGAPRLTSGQVKLVGAGADENAAVDYVIDGGWNGVSSTGCSSLFRIDGPGPSSTVIPSLYVSGVMLQNAMASGLAPIEVNYGSLTLAYSHVRVTRAPLAVLGGGAIRALDSMVNVTRSYLEYGSTDDGTSTTACGNGVFGWAGSIYFQDDGRLSLTRSAARLTLLDSTIRGSKGCRGGAIAYLSSTRSSFNMQNSTIAENTAPISGGGLYLTGRGSVTLLGNTIAHNSAATSANFLDGITKAGGGIAFSSFTGALTMRGNIMAQNLALSPRNENNTSIADAADCYKIGSFTTTPSASFNLIGQQGNCTFAPVGPLVGVVNHPVDPRLGEFDGALQMYLWSGALGMYTGLLPGSPAIASNGGSCLNDDERGFFRASSGCDLGAYQTACQHDPCQQGGALSAQCGICAANICGQDPFCCESGWDGQCVSEVESICGLSCQ